MRKSLFLKKTLLGTLYLFLVLIFCFLLFFQPLSFELKKDSALKEQMNFPEDKILSYLKQYKSHFIWQAPLKKMAKDIEKISLGLDIYIHRRYPNKLIIGFSEKETALLLLTKESELYSVSYKGSLGNKKDLSKLPNVPILRGKNFETNKELRKKALELLKPLPPNKNLFSLQNLSEILYDEKEESFLIYLSTRAWLIKLKSPVSTQKVKNIEFVLEYLQKEEKDHKLIDARFDKKIIVKKKK